MAVDGLSPVSELDPGVAAESGTPAGSAAPASVWCTVRVHGPRGAVDVALPTALPVAEVTERLRSHLLPGAPLGSPGESWCLHRLGEPALPGEALLAVAGLHDGDSLHLSRDTVPRPAQPVDDALVALAEGVAERGRWSARSRRVAVALALAVAAATAVVPALGLVPGQPAPAAVLAVLLLGAAVLLRAGVGAAGAEDGADLPALGAAVGSLPAWMVVGVATADAAGGDPDTRLTLVAAGLTLGVAMAAVVLPTRAPWWIVLGGCGLVGSVGGSLVAADLLGAAPVGALAATLALVVLAAVPWVLTRSRRLAAPDSTGTRDEARRRARQARDLVTAVTVTSVVVTVLGAAVAAGAGGSGLALAAVAVAVLLLRARRSGFVGEAGAGFAGAGVLLAVVVVEAFRDATTPWRLVLGLGALVLLGGLVTVGRATLPAGGADADGRPGPALAWWTRPRTRRALDAVETLALVAMLPLLAGVLGLYGLAADAGSRL